MNREMVDMLVSLMRERDQERQRNAPKPEQPCEPPPEWRHIVRSNRAH